jgi:hypothetical protein
VNPLTPARPTDKNPWLFPLLAAFLLAALFGLHKINDSDLGCHLSSGQWILDHHTAPIFDPSTYTVPDHRYIDLEWLYQVLLILGSKLGGYSLLSIVFILLSLTALTILWLRLKAENSPALTTLLFTCAVLACEARFRVRPEVLTWVLLGLNLWTLEQRAAHGRDRVFWLPWIQLLWVNTEGLFFLGFASMLFFGVSGRLHNGKWDKKLLKVFGISLALSLFNPYFLDGFLFPFRLLTSLSSSDLYHSAIQEFQNPWTFTASPGAAFPFYLRVYEGFTLLLFASMVATFRTRKLHEWALALFFFALSVMAIRNIPLFMLACAPIGARAVRELPWQFPFHQKVGRTVWAPTLLTLFLMWTGLSVVTDRHWVELRQSDRFGLGLDKDALPEGACRFLKDHHLEGRLINDIDTGNWLCWGWGGKTFIDGHLDVMGPDLFEAYTQAQMPGAVGSLITQVQPDIFCFNPLIIPSWATDLPALGWRLVYLDSSSVIFIRKGYQDGLPDLDWDKLLKDHGVAPDLGGQAREILEGEYPRDPNYPLDLFKPSDYRNDLLTLGIASGFCGHWKESEAFFLTGVQRTQRKYWDFYYNLGLLYDFEGRNDLAVLCMERAQSTLPKNPALRRILGLPPAP